MRRLLAVLVVFGCILVAQRPLGAAADVGPQSAPAADAVPRTPPPGDLAADGPVPAQGPVIPTPGSCAPQDPQTPFFQNVINGIPFIGDVSKVVGLVGSVLGTMVEWIAKPAEGAHAIAGWGLWNLFGYNVDEPSCYSPTSPFGFFSSVFMGDVQLGADSIYSDAYNALAIGGMVLVFLAGMVRLVRGMADPEVRGEHLILDTMARVIVGVAAIYISFPLLAWLLPMTTSVGVWIFTALLSIAAAPAVRDPLGVLLYTSIGPILQLGLMALIVLPFAIWFVLKIIGLLIIRFLIVCFGVMFLPLLIAVAVFDPRSKAVRWWLEALASAAITPVVTAALLGGTLGLALRFGEGSPSDGLFSSALIAEIVVALGGMWLCGRVLRALLFHDLTAGEHPLSPLRKFFDRAVAMAALVPAAASGLLTGPIGAAVAYSSGGTGGLAVLGAAQRLRGGRSGGDSGSSSAGAGMPGSPLDVLMAFRGSAEGGRVAEEATPDLPADTGPRGRWAALSADPGMSEPLQRLRTAVLAHVTRTGQMGVAPDEATRFVQAAQVRRSAANEEAA